MIIFVTQPGYETALYDYNHTDDSVSVTIIIDLQKNLGSFGKYFWIIYVNLVFFAMIVLPVSFGFLIYSSRYKALFYWIVFSLFNSLACLLKLYFHSPRPFWVNSEIEPIEKCSTHYGNPSRTTVICIGMSVVFWLDHNKQAVKHADSIFYTLWMRVALGVLLILACTGLAYAKILMG